MIYLINTHPLVPSTVPGLKGKDKTVREDIQDSISRLTKDDCIDICNTFGLSHDNANKTSLRKYAFADEDIAEYVLLH
tara:strand:- start:209 stop:442 length:234 start_codon:yes stop_codon:yes gene_type:complete